MYYLAINVDPAKPKRRSHLRNRNERGAQLTAWPRRLCLLKPITSGVRQGHLLVRARKNKLVPLNTLSAMPLSNCLWMQVCQAPTLLQMTRPYLTTLTNFNWLRKDYEGDIGSFQISSGLLKKRSQPQTTSLWQVGSQSGLESHNMGVCFMFFASQAPRYNEWSIFSPKTK